MTPQKSRSDMRKSRLFLRKNGWYLGFGAILVLMAIVVGSWIGKGRTPATPSGYERTEIPHLFAKQRVIDVGMVPPGSLVEEAFHLKNLGRVPLSLAKTKTTCGCTTAEFPKGIIPPGGSVSISLKVDISVKSEVAFREAVSLAFIGERRQDVGRVVLSVKGLIDRTGEVRCWPTALDFGEVMPGQKITKTVYFRAVESLLGNLPDVVHVNGREEQALRIPSALTMSVKRMAKPLELVLNVPEKISEGRFQSTVELVFASQTCPRVTLRLHANVTSGVRIEPSSLCLVVPRDGSRSTTQIRIVSAVEGRPFQIQGIKADVPVICTIVKDDPSGALIREHPASKLVLSGLLRGKITFDLGNLGLRCVPIVLTPVSAASDASPIRENDGAKPTGKLTTSQSVFERCLMFGCIENYV